MVVSILKTNEDSEPETDYDYSIVDKDEQKGRKGGFFGTSFRRRSSNGGSVSKGEESCCTAITEANTVLKEVTFNLERNVVHKIKPLCRTEEDKQRFFWVRDELGESRTESKRLTTSDDYVKDYIRAFDSAYRQVHTERKLGSETLRDMVQGMSQGFRGLEQHTCHSAARRKKMMKEHTLSVVNFYHEQTFGSSTFSMGSVGSANTSFSLRSAAASTSSSSNTHRVVRNHASKLSAGNRHFAAAIGKADRLAVNNQESLETGSTIATRERRRQSEKAGSSTSQTSVATGSQQTIQHRRSSV